jgi:8-oxo-dGTP diphosphatase
MATVVAAKPPQDIIEAAGGLVERNTPDGLRIAVILRERYGTEWALPKGKKRTGESWQEAALLEVREETGLSATVIGLAGASSYIANGSPKLVVYFRMRANETAPFVPNDETTRLEWCSPEEAIMTLSHQDQSKLVAASLPRPRRTRTRLLAHASMEDESGLHFCGQAMGAVAG